MKLFKYLAVSTKLRFALTALLTTFLICQTAISQTGQQGRIYKDSTNAVLLYGLQPVQQVQVVADFAPAKYITSNACGMLIIKRSKAQAVGKVRTGGVTIDPATLPTQLLPSCKSGTLAEPRLTPFKTSIGSVILPKAASTRYQVLMLNQPRLRNLKANVCGFLKIPGKTLGDQPILPTTTGGLARFAVNQLPQFPPLLCKTKQLYVPIGFPPPLATAIGAFNPDQWEASATGQNGDGSQSSGSSQTGGSSSQTGGTSPGSGTSSSSGTSQTGSGSSGSGSQTSGGSQTGGTSSGSGSSGIGSSSGSGSAGSQPPTISPIAPQIFNGTTEQVISFTIADPDTPLDQIQLSSNIASFPDDFEYGTFSGTGANRTLTIKPKRSSSGLPIQISVGDGTNTTSQSLQLAFAENSNPPSPVIPPPRICRGAGGIVATRFLNPNTYYNLGFDDWSLNADAASNSVGSATFVVEIPPNETYSNEPRNMVIIENDRDLFYRAPLSQIPGC